MQAEASAMNDRISEPGPSDSVSMFYIGTVLLRRRGRILAFMLAGGILSALPVLFQGLSYTSKASFIPQQANGSQSGLQGLAGQLGISVGGGGSSPESPLFYSELLKSPVILRKIAQDSFAVDEVRGPRQSFLDLMRVAGGTPNARIDRGVDLLLRMMSVELGRETGVVSVAVTSAWPSISAKIANAAIDGINNFNLNTRRTQASDEREFTEARLGEARLRLRVAEDRLEDFLKGNREVLNSPQLTFQRDRLQRSVALEQEIVQSLAKSYEETRIREVRDLPVITVIERGLPPTKPHPRGRIKRVFYGLLLGALVGSLVSLLSIMFGRKGSGVDPGMEEFFQALGETKRSFFRFARRKGPKLSGES